jgi:hypothetical protein
MATQTNQIKADLKNLQEGAALQYQQYEDVRKKFYETLADLYIWWRKASKVTGLLNELYQTYGIVQQERVVAGINFSGTLKLVWNAGAHIPAAKISQWNKALNKVHTDWENKRAIGYYKANPKEKIADFIQNNGGIVGLAGYPKDEEDIKVAVKKSKTTLLNEIKKHDLHLNNAKQYFAQAKGIAKLTSSSNIATNDSLYTVLLAKKGRGDQYEILGSTKDNEILDQVLVKTYSRDLTVIPYSLRLLVEIISTQALPYGLDAFYTRLLEDSTILVDGKKAKQSKKLTYIALTNQIILSSNRSNCGIVTIVDPVADIFKSRQDIVMNSAGRRFIEKNLLLENDYNLYTPTTENSLTKPKDPDIQNRRILRLERKYSSDHRYLWFYPMSIFNDDTKKQATRNSTKFKPQWQIRLGKDWFDELNETFVDNWTNGKGQHITRKENQFIGFEFNTTTLTISWMFRARKFEVSEKITFPARAIGSKLTVYLISKEIISFLSSIKNLKITREILIAVDKHMIEFQFATAVGRYKVYIPTCNDKGKRNDTYFEAYLG